MRAAPDQLPDAISGLAWGLRPPAQRLTGSLSGAGVFRVSTSTSDDVIVKITMNGPGQPLARRELDFYQNLSAHVPVRTPQLLRHTDTDEHTALMLSAHTPMPPAREWQSETWLEVARQLANLHGTILADHDRWVTTSWLDTALRDSPTEVAQSYWSGTAVGDQITGLLDETDALGRVRAKTHQTLIHGDCHADNFLCDGDELVWSDWQGVSISNPADDLAFLWTRANSDSANLPCDEMLEVYLVASGADAVGRRSFTQSVLASEIGILLFGWPMYARLHPQDEHDGVTRRFLDLIQMWQRRS